MKKLRLKNSLGNTYQDFEPIDPSEVRYYHCGPTPYDYAHIGNFRSFLFADILIRTLKLAGYKATSVINITDIDDKLIAKAKSELDDQASDSDILIRVKQIARYYASIFFEDLEKLNISKSSFSQIVWATEHIAKMQTMILDLVEQKLAYPGTDGIYFDIRAYIQQGHRYGQLVDLDLSNLEINVIEDEYDKEDVADFALWKFQVDNQPAWDFVLGNGINLRGRPGWHIECSAMSTEYLGDYFDLHTGGEDLKFPHHENEIAQCQGKQAKYYLHNAMLMVEGHKMSKSLGNIVKLADLEDPLAFRYQVLSTHYSSIMDFSENAHQASIQALHNFRIKYSKVLYANKELVNKPSCAISAVLDAGIVEKFYQDFSEAMYDDLATPRALASLAKLIKTDSLDPVLLKAIAWADQLLGLDLTIDYQAFNEQEIRLIDKRNNSRLKANYQTSDQLKDDLSSNHNIDSIDLSSELSLYYRKVVL